MHKLILVAAVSLACYFSLIPLGLLLWSSFQKAGRLGQSSGFTFSNYLTAYANPQTLPWLWNSVIFAIGVSLLSFSVGTALAWINERTDTPFKSFFFALSLVPLIIPGILFTVAWIFLLSPEIGVINHILMSSLGLKQPVFNVYSMGGMVWVAGLHLAPMAFMLMSSSFKSMDPTLEDASFAAGAGLLATTYHVTLKLSRPALLSILLITFVLGIESFEIPALIGIPAGIPVFTTLIYQSLRSYPINFGLANVFAVTLLIITSTAIYVNNRLTRDTGRFSTITGKAFRPRVIKLGAWKYLTGLFFLSYALVIVILPLFVLIWASLHEFYVPPSWQSFKEMTLNNYRYLAGYPLALRAAQNSLFLGVASATAVMTLTALLAWIVVRGKSRFRWLIDNITFLPLVFPGIVLGVALMLVYMKLPIPIYGTIWILLVAYLTRYMPYGMRYSISSMIQINKELEECALVCGGTRGSTFRKIILPLLMPGLLGGWTYIITVSVRELASSILLYSPGNEVLAVTIWNLWENGQTVVLSALGVILIAVLLVVAFVSERLSRRMGIA